MFFRKVAVVWLAVALGCLLTSCGKSKKNKNENANATQERFIKTITTPDQEAIALLSQKYDLQPSLVESFSDRYLSDTDMGYKLLKDTLTTSNSEKPKTDANAMNLLNLDKKYYFEALEKASQAAGISVKSGTLLVSDYRMLTKKGEVAN